MLGSIVPLYGIRMPPSQAPNGTGGARADSVRGASPTDLAVRPFAGQASTSVAVPAPASVADPAAPLPAPVLRQGEAWMHLAADYDGARGNNDLIQDMRAEMWRWLAKVKRPKSKSRGKL